MPNMKTIFYYVYRPTVLYLKCAMLVVFNAKRLLNFLSIFVKRSSYLYTYPQSISFRVHWIDDLHKMHRCINMILCALSDDAAFIVIFMQSYLIWYHADNASYENKLLLMDLMHLSITSLLLNVTRTTVKLFFRTLIVN